MANWEWVRGQYLGGQMAPISYYLYQPISTTAASNKYQSNRTHRPRHQMVELASTPYTLSDGGSRGYFENPTKQVWPKRCSNMEGFNHR
jgi:hypothetical protein